MPLFLDSPVLSPVVVALSRYGMIQRDTRHAIDACQIEGPPLVLRYRYARPIEGNGSARGPRSRRLRNTGAGTRRGEMSIRHHPVAPLEKAPRPSASADWHDQPNRVSFGARCSTRSALAAGYKRRQVHDGPRHEAHMSALHRQRQGERTPRPPDSPHSRMKLRAPKYVGRPLCCRLYLR
jgi:hypothetical protein